MHVAFKKEKQNLSEGGYGVLRPKTECIILSPLSVDIQKDDFKPVKCT